MLSATIMLQLRKKLTQYEGNVPHMYIDTKGHVTVGIGHMLSSVTLAEKLPFIVDKTGKPATASEIKHDFDNVLKHKMKNAAYFYYKKFTTLSLNTTERKNLVDADINSAYKDLKIVYPKFNTYPDEVKLALFDLMFNQGEPNMRTKWPSLNKAIRARNWKAAAHESHRAKPFPVDRNKYVNDLFLKAAATPVAHHKP